jgi:CDP-diglyceride synthetase
MRLAFVTGALAAGFAAAALSALVVWVLTIVLGSNDPWAVAPFVVTAIAVVVTLVTYAAESGIHRRTLESKRETGEPWAYRDD